jgi:hypothetical protein
MEAELGIGHDVTQEMGSFKYKKVYAYWVPHLKTEEHKLSEKCFLTCGGTVCCQIQ